MCLKSLALYQIPNVRGPGQPFFLDIERKVFWFLTIFVQQIQKISVVFEILREEHFRGWSRNILLGPFIEKMKIASCWEPDSKQIFFNNAVHNVCRFRDIWD